MFGRTTVPFWTAIVFSPPLDFSITARLPSSDKYITKPVIGLVLFESQEAS
jgi:hypothetical protein